MTKQLTLLVSLCFILCTYTHAQNKSVEFRDGDRIVLLGSTFLERAQRYGYLEAELTRRCPDRQITFRNLAWSGDTVFGDSWIYSKSHADHMIRREQIYTVVAEQKPTVVVLGYGAIEAFDGDAGLGRWRSGLNGMLDRLGRTGARLMLLTSPPQQPAKSQFASTYNRQLAAYTSVMKDVAAKRELPLIDLGMQLTKYYEDHPQAAITENGMHFNSAGYHVLARLMVEAMGGPPKNWSVSVDVKSLQIHAQSTNAGQVIRDEQRLTFPLTDDVLPQPRLIEGKKSAQDNGRLLQITGLDAGRYTLYIDGTEVVTADARDLAQGIPIDAGPAIDRADELRQAIVEKNRLFFARWRPENETYLKGFRRSEQGRNVVELPLFDTLVAKQEQEIARLKQPQTIFYHLIPAAPSTLVSKSGLELPSTLPDSDPETERATFDVADGFEVSLFASEPMVTNPINMNWDAQGRLWVATSPIYPLLKPGQKANDKIIILEDTDGDGRADQRTVFAEGLLVPTSVLPGDGGAYVTNSTELVHMSDTDGDGRADHTRVLLSGFGTEDTHHILHGFRWAPGGRLFFTQSVLINSHVETPQGVQRLAAAGFWDYDPVDGSLDIYARGMVNPWGLHFDRWGQSFATDGAYSEGINYVWPGAAFFWARDVPRTLKGMNAGQPKECGLEIVSGRHLPDEWQHRMLTADFRAHRVVTFELSESQSGYFSQQKEDLIQSDHTAFRPVDIKMGPDGAIYICDWYNVIIQHGEVDFRDPRRDHQHGRIWRITAKGRPTIENPQLATAGVTALIDAMQAPEQWTRDTARQELKYRDYDEVIDSLHHWLSSFDRSDPNFDQQRLEALWAFETINSVPPVYLQELLHSADHRVRAAAVRVLNHARNSLPQKLSLLEEAIIDDHPRVRLEAINSLRAVGTLQAFETALRALDHPMDELIDYALWTTVRELEPVWLPPFEAGQVSFNGNVGRVAFVLAASEKRSVLAPLVERFRKGQLDAEVRDKVAELISITGDAGELRLLLDRALVQKSSSRSRLLNHLVTAARDRRINPDGDLSPLTNLVPREPAAVTLAGLWQLESAEPAVQQLATDTTASVAIRKNAIAALADFGHRDNLDTLTSLTSGDQIPTIRAEAIAAITSLDLQQGVVAAVEALPTLKPAQAEIVFDAFLHQSDGPQALAERVRGRKLPSEVASLGMNKAAAMGDRTQSLVAALMAAGGAIMSRARLEPAEWRKLLSEITTHGDAARGEAVYRRASLGCMKCHAIGGAGGKVGPDLMSLGASAPLDYVADSLVNPSSKIKEGYETTLVILDTGQVLTGTVLGEIGEHLLLRNSNNVVQKVPENHVEEKITQSVSLMPPGITDVLSRRDFVDLVGFLMELGKSPEFRVPARETVRVWQTLRSDTPITAQHLVEGKVDGGTWSTAFSQAAGSLPLDELPTVKLDGRQSYVLRFQLDAHQAGKLGLQIQGTASRKIWIDRQFFPETGHQVMAEVDTGSHWVVLAVDASNKSPDQLRIERIDLAQSAAQFAFKLEF